VYFVSVGEGGVLTGSLLPVGFRGQAGCVVFVRRFLHVGQASRSLTDVIGFNAHSMG